MNYNKEQQQWVNDYEYHTGFDVIISDPIMTFEQIARWNIDWYDNYSNDVMHKITNYPNPEFK